MRVLIAPDKFRGSVSAARAAAALAAGIRAVRPDIDVAELPVADGGEGMLAAALAAGFSLVPVTAEGPVGNRVGTAFAVRGRTAVIELADVAGAGRLPGQKLVDAGPWGACPWGAGQAGAGQAGAGKAGGARSLAPLTASTYGVGQVIKAALEAGAGTIVLGVGGSVSTDGGAGMVQALGVRLTDAAGHELSRGGGPLAGLARAEVSALEPALAAVRLLVACDVENPLTGPAGAARVFGPQKGAGPADVETLERALIRWARVTASVTGRNLAGVRGAGAAGGAAFGAAAYLGAELVSGAELVLELIGFEAALAGADLVITGEGSLDEQTLRGKAPAAVARAAARRGIPVVAVAGRVLLTQRELTAAGFEAAWSLADLEPDLAVSMARAPDLLARIGRRISARPPLA